MNHQFLAASKVIKTTNITPEQAQYYLDNHNTKNRKINPTIVEKYAQDMKQNQWLHGADCVTFDRNGTLLNGQQRLAAVVKAGKPVEFDIKYGLPVGDSPDDRGRKRSLVDALRMSGNTTVNTGKVMIARNWYGYEHGWKQSSLTSDIEISSFLIQKEAIVNSVAALYKQKRGVAKAGFLTAIAAFAEKNESRAIEFAKQVIEGVKSNGEGLRIHDAAKKLREYLLQDRGGGAGKILENAEKTFYAIYAWNNNMPCPKLGRKTKLEL